MAEFSFYEKHWFFTKDFILIFPGKGKKLLCENILSQSCFSRIQVKNLFSTKTLILPLFKRLLDSKLIIGLSQSFKDFKSENSIRKHRPKWVQKLSFPNWHTRISLYLTFACVRSIVVRNSFSFLYCHQWGVSMSNSRGTLDVLPYNWSWGRQGYECPSDVGRVTRS